MTIREEIQIAIRLKQHDGRFRYEQYVDNGPGMAPSSKKLTLEIAKNQLGLYTASAEATVVTRKVVINEGDWEEVEISEIKELAAILHKKKCHVNHIDQCDWEYGGNRPVHKEYEGKAKAILDRMSLVTAKELLEIF